jgi:hypothetical protein
VRDHTDIAVIMQEHYGDRAQHDWTQAMEGFKV